MSKSKPKKTASATPRDRATILAESQPKRIGTVEESLARLTAAVESVGEVAALVEKTLAPVLPGPQAPVEAHAASFGATTCPLSRKLSELSESIEARAAAIRDTLSRVQF